MSHNLTAMPSTSSLGDRSGRALPSSTKTIPPPPSSSFPSSSPVPRLLLLRWNGAMSLFHLSLFVVTLSVGNVDLAVPLFKTMLDFRYVNSTNNATGDDRPWEIVPYYVESGSLPFTILVASFFALSSLFHALNATLWKEYYLSQLERCRTPTRWIEYFFSAPVMIVAVAYTLGIRDRAQIIAIAALVATTMPFGYWVEVTSSSSQRGGETWSSTLSSRLLPWFLGHVPQIAAWALIVLQFYDGADPEDKAPAFVHVILWSELALFFSFGFASLLSQLVPPSHFYKGELAFQVLSLVSKGLLGILLLANVLMLSRFDDLFE